MTTYPASIEVYAAACDEILSWMTDWLHQSEFDRLSLEHDPVRTKCGFVPYTGDTIVLWIVQGDQNLALLKEMVRAKIVEKRTRPDGFIEYRRLPE